MINRIDSLDRQLVILLQEGLPLTKKPYGILAACLGIDQAEVLLRIQKLKNAGVFFEIQPFFDLKKMGLSSVLVAMKIAGGQTEIVANRLKDHPALRRLTRRDHSFALWANLVGPEANIRNDARQIAKLEGVDQILLMPAVKTFRMEGSSSIFEQEELILRNFQGGFPLEDCPFSQIATRCGLEEKVLIEKLMAWKKRGILKAILPVMSQKSREHQTEVMVAWRIPSERIGKIIFQIRESQKALQCRVRVAEDDFPYNVHATVYGRSLGQCFERAREIDERIGQWPSVNLLMLQEYKVSHQIFFTESDVAHWEQRALEQV